MNESERLGLSFKNELSIMDLLDFNSSHTYEDNTRVS